MRKEIILIAVAALCLAACTNFKDGKGGSQFKIVEDKKGPLIKDSDVVILNGAIMTEADSIISSTYQTGQPSVLMIQKSKFKGDLNSSLKLLSEGDSAIFKINIDSMAARSGQPRPKNINGNYFLYTVRMLKVFAKGATETDSVFQKRVVVYLKAAEQQNKAAELAKVKKYINDNKLGVATTASGLNYVITTRGTGPHPVPGDTCLVNYASSFFSGKVFDTNIKEVAVANKMFKQTANYKPVAIAVGKHIVIEGWDEGLMLLQKGSKAKLVIPSQLAYGEKGARGLVPPYTPIVFDVELVGIKHPDPAAPALVK